MKKLLLLIILLSSMQLQGQISFFSQYASSPLNMNPANTGLINGSWRALTNYRNDWYTTSVPFVTTSFSVDMKFIASKSKRSLIGLGIIRSDRVSGDGHETNRQTGVSIAYHRLMNMKANRPSILSIGLQSSVVQKSGMIYDWWGRFNQDYIIDPYIDYNAGLMYTGYLCTRLSFYSGFTYSHFTKPVENILGEGYRLHSKVSTQIGGDYALSKRLNILFSGLYEQQGKAYDVQIGSAAGYNLTPKQTIARKQTYFYLGAWYKYNDALTPYIGFECNGFRLGLSTDINHALTEATEGGSFEVSLIYNGGKNNFLPNQVVPKF